MKNLKKTYKVRNHKKTEHIYTLCGDVAEYLDILATHDGSTMFVWKEKGERREITYLDFVEAVRALGLGLEEIFGKSTEEKPVRIAVIGESSPKWFAAYLAIMASGYTVVPMDKELAVSEIGGFLKFAGIGGVVYSASFAAAFEEMAPTHETLDVLVPMSDPESDAPAGVRRISFNSLCALGRSTGREFEPDDDRERVAELLFTSGTTGSSKCVMLCQRNIFAAMGAACESVDFRSDDVLVSVLPLHHTYELTCTWLAGLNFGLTICINDSLRNVLKSFREYQPTGLVLVPLFITTMYKKILTEAKKSGKDKILQGAIKAAHAMSMMGVDMSDKLFGDVREAFGGRRGGIERGEWPCGRLGAGGTLDAADRFAGGPERGGAAGVRGGGGKRAAEREGRGGLGRAGKVHRTGGIEHDVEAREDLLAVELHDLAVGAGVDGPVEAAEVVAGVVFAEVEEVERGPRRGAGARAAEAAHRLAREREAERGAEGDAGEEGGAGIHAAESTTPPSRAANARRAIPSVFAERRLGAASATAPRQIPSPCAPRATRAAAARRRGALASPRGRPERTPRRGNSSRGIARRGAGRGGRGPCGTRPRAGGSPSETRSGGKAPGSAR